MDKKPAHLVRKNGFGGLFNDPEIALMKSLSKRLDLSRVQVIVDALEYYEKATRDPNQLDLFKNKGIEYEIKK